jgi:RNA polymerase sigma-70 factor (ECF subfamily)
VILIARSRALDHLRRRRARVASENGPEQAIWNDPGSALDQSESAERVREALTQLPAEQQSAINLAFFGGLTYEQVADSQGIPPGTAKTRIRLGMKRLRELLCRQPNLVT